MSECDGLWKHQNNAACTENVSLIFQCSPHFSVGVCTKTGCCQHIPSRSRTLYGRRQPWSYSHLDKVYRCSKMFITITILVIYIITSLYLYCFYQSCTFACSRGGSWGYSLHCSIIQAWLLACMTIWPSNLSYF